MREQFAGSVARGSLAYSPATKGGHARLKHGRVPLPFRQLLQIGETALERPANHLVHVEDRPKNTIQVRIWSCHYPSMRLISGDRMPDSGAEPTSVGRWMMMRCFTTAGPRDSAPVALIAGS